MDHRFDSMRYYWGAYAEHIKRAGMIKERELFYWLQPIAKWGDILTFTNGRAVISDIDIHSIALSYEGNDKISQDRAWVSPMNDNLFNLPELKLWRCHELPTPNLYSEYQCSKPNFNWRPIATYQPKEETITIPKAEYDKMKRRYEAFKECINKLDKDSPLV